MAKKRRVAKRRHNELRIQILAVHLPKISPLRFWKGLKRHREEGWELPETWDVQVRWKNKDIAVNSDWRPAADFMTALSDSGAGFGVLVDRIIDKNIRRYSE